MLGSVSLLQTGAADERGSMCDMLYADSGHVNKRIDVQQESYRKGMLVLCLEHAGPLRQMCPRILDGTRHLTIPHQLHKLLLQRIKPITITSSRLSNVAETSTCWVFRMFKGT